MKLLFYSDSVFLYQTYGTPFALPSVIRPTIKDQKYKPRISYQMYNVEHKF